MGSMKRLWNMVVGAMWKCGSRGGRNAKVMGGFKITEAILWQQANW